jgi:hypothetical protein
LRDLCRPDRIQFDWRARIKELEDLLEKERAEKELLRRELEALRAENAGAAHSVRISVTAHSAHSVLQT